jgi:hypothetical protein
MVPTKRFSVGLSRHFGRVIRPRKEDEEARMKECEEKKKEAEAMEDDEDGDHKTLAVSYIFLSNSFSSERFLLDRTVIVPLTIRQSIVQQDHTSQVGFIIFILVLDAHHTL